MSEPEPTDEELIAAYRQLTKELYEQTGEAAPEQTDEEILLALKEHA